jgi:hypothetical protein
VATGSGLLALAPAGGALRILTGGGCLPAAGVPAAAREAAGAAAGVLAPPALAPAAAAGCFAAAAPAAAAALVSAGDAVGAASACEVGRCGGSFAARLQRPSFPGFDQSSLQSAVGSGLC